MLVERKAGLYLALLPVFVLELMISRLKRLILLVGVVDGRWLIGLL